MAGGRSGVRKVGTPVQRATAEKPKSTKRHQPPNRQEILDDAVKNLEKKPKKTKVVRGKAKWFVVQTTKVPTKSQQSELKKLGVDAKSFTRGTKTFRAYMNAQQAADLETQTGVKLVTPETGTVYRPMRPPASEGWRVSHGPRKPKKPTGWV